MLRATASDATFGGRSCRPSAYTDPPMFAFSQNLPFWACVALACAIATFVMRRVVRRQLAAVTEDRPEKPLAKSFALGVVDIGHRAPGLQRLRWRNAPARPCAPAAAPRQPAGKGAVLIASCAANARW